MKAFLRIIISSALLAALPQLAEAKPSYSFGDGPRKCKTDADCAIIIVSCNKCDWADSVNKESLAESEKTVKDYCDGWRKQANREKECTEVPPVKKREAVCSNHICEARTFYGKK